MSSMPPISWLNVLKSCKNMQNYMFLLSTYPKDHKVHQLDAHSDNCKRLMVGNGHGFRVVPIQKSGFVLFQPSQKIEIFLLIKSLGQAIFFFWCGGGGVILFGVTYQDHLYFYYFVQVHLHTDPG